MSLLEEPDLDSYMDDWRLLDQYNDRILKDMEQKKARSKSVFKTGSQSGKELVFFLEKYPYDYEKGMQVEIQNIHDRSEKYRGIETKVMEEFSFMVELQDEKAVNEIAFSKKEYRISISNQGMITNFNRQKRAMEKLFQKTSVNPEMGEVLLKRQRNVKVQKINKEELRPYLERFGENEIQKEAFIHALEAENIYLIQGPPGTGKTTVIIELDNYITAHGMTVLLSSSSHAAVDNVLEKIDTKDSMLPIHLGKGEDISPEVKKYTLAACTQRLQKSILHKLEQHKIYEEEEDSFVNKLKEEYRWELELLENEIQENYKKYHMMLYRMENRPMLRFVLYDFSSQLFDVTVSKKMQDMYEAGKLSRMTQIISQAQEGIVILSDMERRLRIQPANIRYIMNREIRELVKRLFQIAEKSVFIVSPWINDSEYVLGKEFLEQMENALKKDNFTVTIAYGYKNETEIKTLTDRMLHGKLKTMDKEFLQNKKDIHSELAARRLQERFGNYSNFKMIFRNTHEKVLCYDEKVSLVGSFNYFSYDGGESSNYEGNFFRKEGAALIEDEKFAKELIKIILMQE